MWYQSGSRRDKECDLFEPLFKTPSNKKDNNSFNVKPLLSEMVRPGTPIETKLIGYYNVRDNEEEKAKVFEQYSKNQQMFLTFENEDNKVEIILTRNKNNFEDSMDNIYYIGSWYEENKYIWDSTNELGQANCWLINHISCYSLVKIYKGEYDFNKLI
jgi:hypothetical protein